MKRKSYEYRIQWADLNFLISNFYYYYKYCNEIKLSILLCSKKVRQIFVQAAIYAEILTYVAYYSSKRPTPSVYRATRKTEREKHCAHGRP